MLTFSLDALPLDDSLYACILAHCAAAGPGSLRVPEKLVFAGSDHRNPVLTHEAPHTAMQDIQADLFQLSGDTGFAPLGRLLCNRLPGNAWQRRTIENANGLLR